MARYTGPVCKLCRREGMKLFLKGERCLTPKCSVERRSFPPGMHGQRRARKQSEYGLQLREKQKARRIYGVLERQFVKHYTEAERPAFEAAMNTAAEQYAADVASGKLDGCMWSLFREPLTNEAVLALPITRSHLKQGVALDPNWCSLKNEAIPIECFLEVNGLDEDFDASHLYQDQEFAWRAHRAGASRTFIW